MERLFPDLWNVLHDGSITRIEGEIPGEVRISVDIEYLRERFADAGELIIVTLDECTAMTFREYDSDHRVTRLAEISEAAPSILNGELDDQLCCVFTDIGKLEICCSSASVALDSGRPISLQEILHVAKDYWQDWQSKDNPGANPA